MKLQQKIIKQYKQKYPHHTLQKISNLTGIQLTRVFRIFHGRPMKLTEYEAFCSVIENQEKPTTLVQNDPLEQFKEHHLVKQMAERILRKKVLTLNIGHQY
jgi:hypothetical protein